MDWKMRCLLEMMRKRGWDGMGLTAIFFFWDGFVWRWKADSGDFLFLYRYGVFPMGSRHRLAGLR